ncbi:Pkinase domain containing protein [Trichuris trichiura]|uniref:non-specific serine/threonine protein kinase n=1 Tax=Trichuris trichiura TaxID=36087 RepID=A0A077ZDC2_TRITR|nr:Pkinase domain containing protein [Trichuris trichiura]
MTRERTNGNSSLSWIPSFGEVFRGWKVHALIGSGRYGAVFIVQNVNTKKLGAMKVEDRFASEGMRRLKVEVLVMKDLKERNAKHCILCITYGRTAKFNYIVMPLVGPNLERLAVTCHDSFHYSRNYFSPYTILQIGLKTLNSIREMHRCHYVHRDVKPENFTIGYEKNELAEIFIIDFGMARKFAHQTGQHHRPRALAGFKGSYLYASVNALLENEQSRRDDMWSWFFMLVRFYSGKLPWSNLELPVDCTFQECLKLYASKKDEAIKCKTELLQYCPNSFKWILKRLSHYIHYRQPEYNYFITLLENEIKTLRQRGYSTDIDWLKLNLNESGPAFLSMSETSDAESNHEPKSE